MKCTCYFSESDPDAECNPVVCPCKSCHRIDIPIKRDWSKLKKFGDYKADCPIASCSGVVLRAWDQYKLRVEKRFVLEKISGCTGCGQRFQITDGEEAQMKVNSVTNHSIEIPLEKLKEWIERDMDIKLDDQAHLFVYDKSSTGLWVGNPGSANLWMIKWKTEQA